jgi:hypothetical protein
VTVLLFTHYAHRSTRLVHRADCPNLRRVRAGQLVPWERVGEADGAFYDAPCCCGPSPMFLRSPPDVRGLKVR